MTYSGSLAQAGRGSLFSIGSSPTEIGEVSDVPFNRGEWDQVDVSNFDSAADAEILLTMRKPGSFDITFNRVSSNAGQAAAEAAYQAATLVPFVLQLPKTPAQTTSGDKYTGNMYILGSSLKVSPKDKIAGSLKVMTTGPVTLAVGS
jgi:hypothetical protein